MALLSLKKCHFVKSLLPFFSYNKGKVTIKKSPIP